MVCFRGALFPLLAVAAWGQPVPGRYLVELESPPKSTTRVALAERASVRQAIAEAGGQVHDSFDTVFHGYSVELDDSARASLEQTPGVRRVYPVLEGQLHLDRALDVHQVRAAWMSAGILGKAGAGARIAIIDTGIDLAHPAFRDDNLSAPPGFPRGNRESDLEGTNSKVIVARSYEHLLPGGANPTAQDIIGHGTSVAMAAAGAEHESPRGVISGVAPKAWLGSYKIWAGSGTGTTRSDVVIRAIEDAVRDGMDVINLSMGIRPVGRPDDDPLARAVDQAFRQGVVVVQSSGNSGPAPATTSSPGQSQATLSVGANLNGRIFAAAVAAGSTDRYAALNPESAPLREPIEATAVDAAMFDSSRLVCGQLASGRINGAVLVIARGVCTFEEKLANAANAGASAAIIYSDERPIGPWLAGSSTLPALLISNEAGQRLRGLLARDEPMLVRLDFQPVLFETEPNHLASFSSRGPSADGIVQPEVLAVGATFFTAAQANDPRGDLFDASRYRVTQGTSFSAPMVAGAIAVLKAARPGLRPEDYRSLTVNTASRLNGSVQGTGAGLMNLDAALGATASTFPPAVSFGFGGGTARMFREFTLTNLGRSPESYSISVESGDSSRPLATLPQLLLQPGDSRSVGLNWNAAALAPGAYQGAITIRGSAGGPELRVPYWYGVPDTVPAHLVSVAPASGTAGGTVTVYVRVVDAIGAALSAEPQLTVEEGLGSLANSRSVDFLYPGFWELRLRLASQPGVNLFRLRAGGASELLSIRGN